MSRLGQRFVSGEEEAVREVYEAYKGPVFSVAYGILGDRQLAADAVQLTFLKAWRASRRFDPSRDLAPWLYSIARRAAIDVYRKERRPTQGGHEVEAEVVYLPPGIEHTWEAWEVRRAVENLPDDEREVIRLTHFEGLSQPQIAERVGIPVGTVKSRAFRAHRRLAEMLGHVVEVARTE